MKSLLITSVGILACVCLYGCGSEAEDASEQEVGATQDQGLSAAPVVKDRVVQKRLERSYTGGVIVEPPPSPPCIQCPPERLDLDTRIQK